MAISKKFIENILLSTVLLVASGIAIADESDLCAPFKNAQVDTGLMSAMLQAAEQGDLYRIQPGTSKMGFCVDSPLGMVEAEFRSFKGGMALQQETRQNSALVSIDVASLETNSGFIEAMLKSESFFDIEQYPDILFVSTSFEWLSEQKAILKGELTLHGVTREVAFYVEMHKLDSVPGDDRIMVKATTTIQRSEFGMYTLSPVVSDRVNLCMSVDAYRYRA
ncbi:MAG: YceI family protein [Gammaproteobacteria bacterium]